MKKTLSLLMAAVMMSASIFCFAQTAFASNNYSSASEIQQALNQNKYDSSSQLTVTVSGTYYLSERLVIYSNTVFNCTNAVFIKTYDDSTLLAIGQNKDAPTGNDYYKNITINGGTFDSNKKTGSILSFAHASNVTINGASFKDCSNGHHITFAGCNNVLVTGCSFSGQYSVSGDNMEAVQLDILQEEHFPNYKDYPAAYDGTMNENITVTGCTFENVNRGVGAHSVFSGKYMKNINISNNTFKNVAGYAVLASSFLNVKINGNVIDSCGSGIYYKSINPNGTNTYAYAGNSSAPTVDNYSEIKNNSIYIVDTGDSTSKQGPYAIRLYGEKRTSQSGVIKAGDYRAQNITIESNSINIARSAIGIWLSGAANNTPKSNTITFSNPSYSAGSLKAFGIRLENSTQNKIKSNTISCRGVSYAQCGIILDKSKSNTISSNTVTKAKKHGINISSSSSATIKGNTIKENGENGILCYSKSTITTEKNKISKNKKHGIFINNCSGKIKLSGDKISSNKQNGISLQKATKVTISSAKISKQSKVGIYLTQSSKADIKKCTVSSSTKDGIYATQKSTANISNSTVSSGKQNGIYFTNKAKGSVKNTKLNKNKKYGIYITKKAGKVKISKVKYSSNKSGKIKK